MSNKYLRSTLRILLGIVLVLFGLLGFVTPLVPGIVLLVVGIAVLLGKWENLREIGKHYRKYLAPRR